MKKLFYSLILFSAVAYAQTTDDLLNLLIQKGVVSQEVADSVRSEVALKAQDNPKNQSLKIDLELKPRFEVRNGYGNGVLPSSTNVPAAFTNQRTRLNFDYDYKGIGKAFISIQDVRVWGQNDPRDLSGTLQLFEGYVEPIITDKWSVRIGRQRLMLDNQRLFAENDWRTNAGAHDAVRFLYQDQKLSGDLLGAFNQSTEKFYGTDFKSWIESVQPNNQTAYNTTWSNQWYKALIVGHLKYKFNDQWTVTTINVADAFQRKQGLATATAIDAEHYFWRLTYGGRVEYTQGPWYATFSGYKQSGDNRAGRTVDAFYIQPEIKYTKDGEYSIRFGAEILSGDGNNANNGQTDGNFDALYGVAHRFNGGMDFFTTFGTSINTTTGAQSSNHLKNQGLVNPYLFANIILNDQWSIDSQSHLFFSQHNYTVGSTKYDKFLGYEHDLLLNYKPNKITAIQTGFSFALPSESLAAIKGTTNGDYYTPTWGYIQVKFTPTLFKTKF